MEILGLIDVPVWLLLTLTALSLAYIFFTWTFDFFKKMGVPGPKPYPLFGTQFNLFFKAKTLWNHDRKLVDKYGKFVGTFEGRNPVLIVYDIDVIKQVMVKDFSNFTNRKQIVDNDLFGFPFNEGLSVISDEHWKNVRNLLSPTFTSGKLKRMIPQINECATNLLNNLQELAEKDQYIDIKEYTGFFTMDTVASVAFGLQLNSGKAKDAVFVKMAKEIMTPKISNMILFVLFPFMAWPLKKLGYNFFDPNAGKFFAEVVRKSIQERQAQKIYQTDFLQLMMNAHKEPPTAEDMADDELAQSINYNAAGKVWVNKGLTETEMVCNAVIFLLAGFATTSETLRYLSYYLAINPEIQEKVIEEVDQVTKGQEITSEMVPKLEFLELCTMETLRLRSPAFRTNREARVATTLGGYQIPAGTRIDIPMAALHYDPDIYPEPEKFIPERFLPEERARRDPCYWMPFGMGPRNCIGLRLAMMEVKIGMAKVMQKMRFVKCDKTEDPIIMRIFGPKNPVTLKAEMR